VARVLALRKLMQKNLRGNMVLIDLYNFDFVDVSILHEYYVGGFRISSSTKLDSRSSLLISNTSVYSFTD
jgi:hypothetical protein